AGREIDQPQNPGMGQPPDDGQLAEVLVQRDQHPLLAVRPGEDVLVAGIFGQITRPDDIVAVRQQLGLRPAPDARVQEQLHAAVSILSGSTRSWPTTRRAYTRHARMSAGSSHG